MEQRSNYKEINVEYVSDLNSSIHVNASTMDFTNILEKESEEVIEL